MKDCKHKSLHADLRSRPSARVLSLCYWGILACVAIMFAQRESFFTQELLADPPAKKTDPAKITPNSKQEKQSKKEINSQLGNDYFENHIRPLLSEHCFRCHGPKKQESGLRLDSRAAILKGGDSGPAAIPLQVEKSKIIRAINYEKDCQMPPKGKLPKAAISKMEEWVKMGLPFPESGKVISSEEKDKHWAFQPIISNRPIPNIQHKELVHNGIDSFILAKLESQGRTLSPPADKRTLLRRMYIDLIGIPPTLEQIQSFENDHSPNAVEKVIDSLLANPKYGERWGRYWLDLARFSDTRGYLFEQDRNYPYAYTYRDWVVNALNQDMPYEQFVQYQLAADQLVNSDSPNLAAMGFLTVGRRFLNNIHDIIDDRMDATFRTFMGVTIACARCHDHKFDPIPAKDYYSIYGVFASSVEPADLPELKDSIPNPARADFEKMVASMKNKIQNRAMELHQAKLAIQRKPEILQKYIMAIQMATKLKEPEIRNLIKNQDLNRLVFDRWRQFFQEQSKAHPELFSLLMESAKLEEKEAGKKIPLLLKAALKNAEWNRDKPIAKDLPALAPLAPWLQRELVKRSFRGSLKSVGDIAGFYAEWMIQVFNETNPNKEHGYIYQQLHKPENPLSLPASEQSPLFDRKDRDELVRLNRKLDEQKATHPGSPPRAMIMKDSPNLFQPYVFLRGNPGNHGATIPRQFLQVVTGDKRKPFQKGSGRLEMAQAITDIRNPLTYRVIVNRLWQNHFGQGLVRTPSDFGLRSEPPTHPELLDWLAEQLIVHHGSLKAIHKLMMLSRTYQQSSSANAELVTSDPENRLWARMNRRRLDFESTRDSILAVSKQLDPKIGGKSVDLFSSPYTNRRTLYGFIDRQNLPGTFRIFDFASPDSHTAQRFVTTVPQQGLFLLNNPWIMEQSNKLLQIKSIENAKEDREKIQKLFQEIYARNPNDQEIELCLDFLKTPIDPLIVQKPKGDSWSYGYGRVDEQKHRVKGFKKLPFWNGNGNQWQGGQKIPDEQLNWLILNSIGGHPGDRPDLAVIRRWTAPENGPITIKGFIEHPAKVGDGIRAQIISSRSGTIGSWVVFNQRIVVNLDKGYVVNKGETLDFVADCRTNNNSDSFVWQISIQEKRNSTNLWNSQRDFTGPHPISTNNPLPTSKWTQLVQVLLLSNEFVFVD